MQIPFTRPWFSGKEEEYIRQTFYTHKKTSGNGHFTKLCQQFFEEQYGIRKCLLTTSCTDALEMAAILADIQPGDEVIVPSYTFVSTALAFVRQGAKIIFADSSAVNPNLDPKGLEQLISPKTKVIVPVHYAGISCDMDAIMEIARRHKLLVIEDAAQGIDSSYKGRPLGSLGHMAAFSFHETKNISSGEGGMLCINDERFVKRAEIVWEKGTNRADFIRGEVNKYGWVDMGSSFLPSEVTAAYLWAQLESMGEIQRKRLAVWDSYLEQLQPLQEKGLIVLQPLPDFATNNAHMFYFLCSSLDERSRLISALKAQGVHAVFHYLSLHSSDFYREQHSGGSLPFSDRYTDCLVRLPLFADMDLQMSRTVGSAVCSFFGNG